MTTLILAALLGATEGPTMNEFALVFRPTRTVTAEELPKRNNAAREWALALRRDGVLSFAAPLEDDAVTVTANGAEPSGTAPPIGAVLIIKARDLQSVVTLVKGHPGLAFGTAVEIRQLKVASPAK